jgi:peptidoglycan hydrolase-like protein with peptidoglycan-binding domain
MDLVRLGQASTEEDRIQIEAELLEQTDNRPNPGDGEQPSQDIESAEEDSVSFGVEIDLREAILRRARKQLGTHEEPFGSNITPYSKWYGLIGPWCAMFVSWCFFHEGLPLPATTHKGFAYTPSGAAWFKSHGRWTKKPQKGAVIFFDFPGDGVDRISHVGIVEKVNADGSVTCLEGNTNDAAGRTGGMVMRHIRRIGIVGYGLPKYPRADLVAAEAVKADLRQGDIGPQVAQWQRELNEVLLAGLEVDGEFGLLTRQATVKFQRQQSLEDDGVVTAPTRKTMAKALAARSGSEKTVVHIPRFPGRSLELGDTGKDVRRWQNQMSKLGFAIEVDGEFGPQSASVCRKFQKDRGLPVSGVVNELTWEASFAPQEA